MRFNPRRLTLLMLVGMISMSCTNNYVPADTEEAKDVLFLNSFVHGQQNQNNLTVQIGAFGIDHTKVVSSSQVCQGASGSVLPPLSLKECYSHLPGHVVLDTIARLRIGGNELNARHVILPGIQSYFRSQIEDTDCWAAVLEAGRAYLHLKKMSQEALLGLAPKICPAFSDHERGASMYQILYIISVIQKKYNEFAGYPYVCDTALCIVDALLKKHPIMMLKVDHAVLVVGANFVSSDQDPDRAKNFSLIKLDVLDPAEEVGSAALKTEEWLDLCRADGFIVL